MRIRLLFLAALLSPCAAETLGDVYDEQVNEPPGSDPPIRWASSGGGWRAMFASIGFANVFQQAGLFSQDSSKFSAISTNSGSSWFSTQLFYSQAFYNQTVMAASPEDLYDFATRWMGTYELLADYVVEENQLCNTTGLGNSTLIQVFTELCDTILAYRGDWTMFISTMMLVASQEYGEEDPSWVNGTASAANRIPPLRNTDLYIQSAVSPSTRVRAPIRIPVQDRHGDPFDRRRTQLFGPPDDTIIYLGPSNTDEESLYTTVQGAVYVIGENMEGFYYQSDGKTAEDFRLYKGTTDPEFERDDFEDFDLDGTVDIPNSRQPGGDIMEGVTLRTPFGGAPTINAIAAISSAAVATMSPAASITYAQQMKQAWAAVRPTLGPVALLPGWVLFQRAANSIYTSPLFDNVAVCSQWPDPCGEQDAFFLDGAFVENYALSATISQYQLQTNTDNNNPLKIILTNTNQDWETNDMTQLFQYFESPLNTGVEPGEYLFSRKRQVPFRSPQVFQDYLDQGTIDRMLEPIEGSNMTTAVFPNLITTDNPVYGIQGGLPVELLYINLNEPITTFIVGPSVILNLTNPLAEMVSNIADTEILVQRVRDFYGK